MARLFAGGTDKIQLSSSLSAWNFLHQVGTTGKWSFSLWFRLSSVEPDTLYGLFGLNAGSSNNRGIAFWFDDRSSQSRDHKLICLMSGASNGSPVISFVSSDSFFPKNTNWHHVAWTYDQSLASGNLKVYVDGGTPETATKTGASAAAVDAAFAGELGTIGNGGFSAVGSMAEAAFKQDYVLSASEVLALARGVSPLGIGPHATNRRNYYPLWGTHSPEIDLCNSPISGTLTGTSRTNHPPVSLFSRRVPYSEEVAMAPAASPLLLRLQTEGLFVGSAH